MYTSNLPFILTILEKVVTQLLDHLQRNSLFQIFQSSCRAHHSTETSRVIYVLLIFLYLQIMDWASVLVLIQLIIVSVTETGFGFEGQH